MKKSNFLKAFFGLTIIASFFVGCKDKDTTPPQIFLKGGNPLNWVLNRTYVDSGATAEDNVDGNISSSITVDASLLNVNLAGSYIVTYKVKDSEGNITTKDRTVKVYNEASKYVLEYDVVRTQQFGSQTPISYTTKAITASTTINRRLDFTNFSNLKLKAYCMVYGDNLDSILIPNQKDTLHSGGTPDVITVYNFYGAPGNSYITFPNGKKAIRLKYNFVPVVPAGTANVVTEDFLSN